MKQKFVQAVICVVIVFVIAGCQKTDYEVVSDFRVRLSSSAFDAQQLNVEIKKLQVNISDTSWIDLSTPNQVYDLLAYQNNSDTLIANGNLPATSIVRRLKLTIGQNNSLVQNGKAVQLVTSSNANTLVLDVNKKLNRAAETVNLHFDLSRSVTAADSGLTFIPVATLQ